MTKFHLTHNKGVTSQVADLRRYSTTRTIFNGISSRCTGLVKGRKHSHATTAAVCCQLGIHWRGIAKTPLSVRVRKLEESKGMKLIEERPKPHILYLGSQLNMPLTRAYSIHLISIQKHVSCFSPYAPKPIKRSFYLKVKTLSFPSTLAATERRARERT